MCGITGFWNSQRDEDAVALQNIVRGMTDTIISIAGRMIPVHGWIQTRVSPSASAAWRSLTCRLPATSRCTRRMTGM